MSVAILFCEEKGVYSQFSDVDLWHKGRDARGYNGSAPVVAHPPCQLWGRFAYVNFARWGGEHNRPGNDEGCFASALSSVITYGGVLEHPAFSDAFKTYGLKGPLTKTISWQRRGLHEWVCEVWQSAYGHLARKRTWLFYSGINPPFELDWSRPEAAYQIGFHDQRGKARNKPTISGKKASATPIKFAEELIRLARFSRDSPQATGESK